MKRLENMLVDREATAAAVGDEEGVAAHERTRVEARAVEAQAWVKQAGTLALPPAPCPLPSALSPYTSETRIFL